MRVSGITRVGFVVCPRTLTSYDRRLAVQGLLPCLHDASAPPPEHWHSYSQDNSTPTLGALSTRHHFDLGLSHPGREKQGSDANASKTDVFYSLSQKY